MNIKSFGIAIFQVLVFNLLISNTVFAGQPETTQNIYKQLSAIKCDSLIKANETNPNFVILDVRTPGEWSGYHIMGSINRSTGDPNFQQQMEALPKHKIFLLHCQSGSRSAGAFTKMQNLGFSEVYEMIGGISSWRNAGLSTTTVAAPKLMLVSKQEINGGIADTLKITVTNRANSLLSFESVTFTDNHPLTDNFNREKKIEGAEDYTFAIVHSPGYSGDDSTKISLESNGGKLEISIVFKNGIIQGVETTELEEISIYPNPTKGRLYFKNITASLIEDISVINIAGKIVLNETSVWGNDGIDVSRLPNGIYIVRIKTVQQ
ncbi:MAG TPA: rhodanese-like domain-containing protein, partial [Draconibacterium sp.]|nr:rhodanese-like domain-containing protein [Draconibacterium sp.]